MQTGRGNPLEEKDGYLMVPNKMHNDTQYWRCLLSQKYGCKARGSSEVGSRIIEMTQGHNGHLPDPALAAKYRVATNVKAAARANVLVPSGQIIDQHLEGLTPEEASKVPRRSGGMVDRRPEHIQLPPVFRQTKDHQQFLRVDSRQDESQSPTFLVFASPRGLQQLQLERKWCMDGTNMD